MRPGTLEVSAELHQMLSFLLAQRRRSFRVECCDLSLDPVHAFERHVPPALRLTSDQAIGRIDGVILAARMSSLVARLRQRHSCRRAADISLVWASSALMAAS